MALEIRKQRNPGISSGIDTDSIDITVTGSQVSADLKLSSNAADAGNTLVNLSIQSTGVDGLRAQIPNEDIQDVALGIFQDSDSIDVVYDDAGNAIDADVRLSADAAQTGYIKASTTIKTGGSPGLHVELQKSLIDHGEISGLTDDDHAQYARLAGRATGQVLRGGTAAAEPLTLMSTANAAKGQIIFGSSAYDEALQRLAIRDTSPGVALDVNGDFGLRPTTNTDSGTLTGVPTADTSFIRFTLATAIQGLSNGAEGKLLILTNANSVSCLVQNENAGASAADRIITGTADDIEVAIGASLLLAYDGTSGRWRVIGGAGGGGLAIKSNQTLASLATISFSGSGKQLIRVQGSGGAITVSGTTGITNGTKDGTELRLQGLSNTNTVTLPLSGNLRLNGQCVLGDGDTIDLMWNLSNSTWDETGRSE